MNIIITGKDFKLTSSIKQFVEEKMKKVERHSSKITEMRVELDVDRNQTKGEIYRAEITAHLPGSLLKAGEKAEDLHDAITLSVDKLLGQLRKYKGKHEFKRDSKKN